MTVYGNDILIDQHVKILSHLYYCLPRAGQHSHVAAAVGPLDPDLLLRHLHLRRFHNSNKDSPQEQQI